jgi:hypothetical protein
MPEVKALSTDFTTYFMLVDPTSGDEELNLVISDLVMFYTRNQAGNVSAAAVQLNNASDAHSDWEMFEVHSDNAPGLYRADYPDAALSNGVDKVVFGVRGAAIATATQLWTINNYSLSDVLSELSDVLSDYLVNIDQDLSDIKSDLTKTALSDLATATAVSDVKSELVILSDAISTLDAAVDSDSALYLADHDKTQSDIADLSGKVDSDSLLYISDLSDIISELATGPLSTIASDTAAIEGAGGGLTPGQASDLAAIESDLKKTPLSTLSEQISDIYSDTTALAAGGSDWSAAQRTTILSDLAAIELDTGTTLPTKIDSDATLEAADHDKTQSDVADLSSKVDSDAALEAADHDKTQSDVGDLSAKLGSDVLALETALDSDFLAVENKLDSDMVLVTADHDKTQSDVADLSGKVDSDAALEAADHDKTQSDIADLSGKIDSDSLLYVSDLSDIISELATGPLSTIASDTAAIEGAGGGLTVAQASDLAAIESDLKKTPLSDLSDEISDIYSDTTALAAGGSDWTAGQRAQILSDLAAIEADTGNIYSDTAELYSDTTRIHSDTDLYLDALVSSRAAPADVQVLVP